MHKKRVILCVAVLMLIGVGYYISLPDYYVHTSISESNGSSGRRDTKLTVVAYHFWNEEKLMNDIVDEFNEINDDPRSTSIEVNLYYSKWHMRNAEPFRTEQFVYEIK